MKIKNLVICASLILSSFLPYFAYANEDFKKIDDEDISALNKSYERRDIIISEREQIINDIVQGKNKEFPLDNIGQLEWVKSFSDYEISLPDKGYIIKVIDNETREPRYFGAKVDDIWITPKNIKNFDFALSGFNFKIHNVNPLPIKDIQTINYLSSMKGINVFAVNPIYVDFNKYFNAYISMYGANSVLRLDDNHTVKKEDFFDSYIININGISFYAKEMYLSYNNKFHFKENEVFAKHIKLTEILNNLKKRSNK